MNTIQQGNLLELVRFGGSPCVSIFLPLRRAGTDIAADVLELRNLLGAAGRQLDDAGIPPKRAESMLAPAGELLETIDSWHGHPEGLALFAAPEFFRSYDVAALRAPRVVVDSRFFITPLIQPVGIGARFLLLALTKESVKLYEGIDRRLREIPLHGVATSLEEYLRFTEAERQLQLHSGGRQSGKIEAGRRGAIFHGNGSENENVKQELAEHFRQVDKKVIEVTGNDTPPLVLGGVEYLLSTYRKVTRYGGRIMGEIRGNLDRSGMAELFEVSSRLAEPWFERGRIDALRKFHTLAGTGLTSLSEEEILAAAETGRVESVILEADAEGTDPRTGERDRLDLLTNSTVIATMRGGGMVYRSRAGELSPSERIAAVFRY